MSDAAARTFERLRDTTAPGLALAAKIAGRGAVEVAAAGSVVHLSDGREVLDLGSYAVALLGHRHPAVVAAVTDQLARMPTATRLLANPVLARFAERLAALLGEPLRRVWLGSDGADVVELAIKLARRRTGRPRVLAVQGGFHGKTAGALALTANPAFRAGLAAQPADVTHLDPADSGAVRRAAGEDVAALVVEPIQGEAGVRPLPAATLRAWADDAHALGAYVISDEVQVGLRRCGPWSVAQALGVPVDAVLLGKALGGGVMPLAALVAGEDLYEPLARDPTWHTSTFGGHPLACAAGYAALEAIEALAPRAEQIGSRVRERLAALRAEQPERVRDVRGAGLLWGVELASPGLAGELLVELAHRGVLLSPCLSAPDTLRLLPPMVIDDAQLDLAFERLRAALDAI